MYRNRNRVRRRVASFYIAEDVLKGLDNAYVNKSRLAEDNFRNFLKKRGWL